MGTTGLTVCITHPFHPLYGQTFDVVSRSAHWGEDRVIYRATNGTLPSIAVTLTDMVPPDPFRRIAAERAAFRMVDLQRLVSVLDNVASSMAGDDV
jgi:hypothetical protein